MCETNTTKNQGRQKLTKLFSLTNVIESILWDILNPYCLDTCFNPVVSDCVNKIWWSLTVTLMDRIDSEGIAPGMWQACSCSLWRMKFCEWLLAINISGGIWDKLYNISIAVYTIYSTYTHTIPSSYCMQFFIIWYIALKVQFLPKSVCWVFTAFWFLSSFTPITWSISRMVK